MTFQVHLEEILRAEIDKAVKQQGYILETEFCSNICEKYGFTLYTVLGTLRRIYSEISLIKRRMSADLKKYYKLQIKGYPIVYMPEQ